MIIRDVTPFLLRGDEVYGAPAGGDEATDQGDWLLLVRVRTTDGGVAWSDAETLGPVAARVITGPGMGAVGFRPLGELVTGVTIRDVDDLRRTWHELFIGTVYYGRRGVAMQSLSAIDTCLWSLLAQELGVSVPSLLGGLRHPRIPAYASTLFRATPQGNADAARGYVARGFTGVKFGWGGFGLDPGRDRESLAAIGEALAGRTALMVDPGWYVSEHGRPRVRTEAETRSMLAVLAEVGPVWVEDVVHPEQTEAYPRWAAEFPTLAFAAGEQQATAWELRRLTEGGGLRFLQPDLSRCGGLSVVNEIATDVQNAGVQIVTHSWLTDLLHTVSLQLLSTLPGAPWVEFNVAQSALSRGVVADPLRLEDDGTVVVPTRTAVVDEEFVGAHAVAVP